MRDSDGPSLHQLCIKKEEAFLQKVKKAIFNQVTIDQYDPLKPYWEQMSETHIRQLAHSPLTTIGAHGAFHQNLSSIGLEAALTDLKISKDYLETIIQKPVPHLAYPFGAYDLPLVEAATDMGFKYQFAMDFTHRGEALPAGLWSRMGVNPFISAKSQMYALLRGGYN